MPEGRFVDNGNDTITDNLTGLTWLKKDSRQMIGKWIHLEKAEVWVQELNSLKFGGFDDWRIPELKDIKTIFDRNFINRARGNDEIFIPQIFEPGGADNTWTNTINGDRAMLYNLIKGRSSWINRLGEGPFAVRLVRGNLHE
mgnify:CR=1 FL=1